MGNTETKSTTNLWAEPSQNRTNLPEHQISALSYKWIINEINEFTNMLQQYCQDNNFDYDHTQFTRLIYNIGIVDLNTYRQNFLNFINTLIAVKEHNSALFNYISVMTYNFLIKLFNNDTGKKLVSLIKDIFRCDIYPRASIEFINYLDIIYHHLIINEYFIPYYNKLKLTIVKARTFDSSEVSAPKNESDTKIKLNDYIYDLLVKNGIGISQRINGVLVETGNSMDQYTIEQILNLEHYTKNTTLTVKDDVLIKTDKFTKPKWLARSTDNFDTMVLHPSSADGEQGLKSSDYGESGWYQGHNITNAKILRAINPLTNPSEYGMVLAGGFFSSMITNRYCKDFDLFFINKYSSSTMISNIILMCQDFQAEGYSTKIYRTSSVVTIVVSKQDYHPRVFQVILKQHANIAQVLYSFDLAATQVAWDGTNFYFTQPAYLAMKTGLMVVDFRRAREAFEPRVVKYFNRGFSLILPDMCTNFKSDDSDTSGNSNKWLKLGNYTEFKMLNKNTGIEVVLVGNNDNLTQYQRSNHYQQLKSMVEHYQGKLYLNFSDSPDFKNLTNIQVYCKSNYTDHKDIKLPKHLKQFIKHDQEINIHNLDRFSIDHIFKLWLLDIQVLTNAGNGLMRINRTGNGRRNALVVTVCNDPDRHNIWSKVIICDNSCSVMHECLTYDQLAKEHPNFYQRYIKHHIPINTFVVRPDEWHNDTFTKNSVVFAYKHTEVYNVGINITQNIVRNTGNDIGFFITQAAVSKHFDPVALAASGYEYEELNVLRNSSIVKYNSLVKDPAMRYYQVFGLTKADFNAAKLVIKNESYNKYCYYDDLRTILDRFELPTCFSKEKLHKFLDENQNKMYDIQIKEYENISKQHGLVNTPIKVINMYNDADLLLDMLGNSQAIIPKYFYGLYFK